MSLLLIVLLFGLFFAILVLKNYLALRRAREKIGYWPGLFNLVSPFTPLGILLPPIRGIHRGRHHGYNSKHESFRKVGYNVISNFSFFPPGASLSIADADVLRQICGSRVKFPKPTEGYGVLKLFGSNIVITEGEEWKKHRKIAAPAFSDRNNKLVWNSTIEIMDSLYNDVWGANTEVVTVDHFLDVSVRIALMVLSIAGYGRPMSWTQDTTISKSHTMTFTEAITTVTMNLPTKLFFPDWMLSLTSKTRRVKTAFEELHRYIVEMIEDRKKMAQEKEGSSDLLTHLVQSYEEDMLPDADAESMLSLSETIGNVFIFLVAGHETTAHTLCYVFGLLALYPDEQDKLFQHIKSVVGDRKPVYEDFMSLDRVLACFYEALRLYPVVTGVPKRAAEDTVFYTTPSDPSSSDPPVPIYVKKGTGLSFHVTALHYNPRYWKDPFEFRPERFLGDWNRDAFIVFSSGARACIGRRFSESEAVAVMTSLLLRYKVSIKDEPQFAGESLEEKRERVLKSNIFLTLTPLRLPLVFTKR